jgi:hypothetical protein
MNDETRINPYEVPMDLRDTIAVEAMQAILSHITLSSINTREGREKVASLSYEMAYAMINERKKYAAPLSGEEDR